MLHFDCRRKTQRHSNEWLIPHDYFDLAHTIVYVSHGTIHHTVCHDGVFSSMCLSLAVFQVSQVGRASYR